MGAVCNTLGSMCNTERNTDGKTLQVRVSAELAAFVVARGGSSYLRDLIVSAMAGGDQPVIRLEAAVIHTAPVAPISQRAPIDQRRNVIENILAGHNVKPMPIINGVARLGEISRPPPAGKLYQNGHVADQDPEYAPDPEFDDA